MKSFRTGSNQQGVTLLEALLGILLFSVGILAVVGIQAMAVRNVAESKYRMDASFLANQVLGEMWINQTNLASYSYSGGTPSPVLTRWIASVNSALPGTTANPPTITINGSTITVIVSWQAPEEAKLNPAPSAHKHTVISVIEKNL